MNKVREDFLNSFIQCVNFLMHILLTDMFSQGNPSFVFEYDYNSLFCYAKLCIRKAASNEFSNYILQTLCDAGGVS